jgi:hypothetical protein
MSFFIGFELSYCSPEKRFVRCFIFLRDQGLCHEAASGKINPSFTGNTGPVH